MPDPIYTLSDPEKDTPRFAGDLLSSTRYRVLRNGVEVASIFEHVSTYRGRAFVSMRRIAWAGKQPSGYPKNPDPALFFDFVSDHETAAEALPECVRRVERILEWRKENA